MILWEPAPGRRVVFLRDMVLAAEIGVNPDEQGRRQRVRINVALLVEEETGPVGDNLRAVVDYHRLASSVRSTVAAGHVRLVETLAERLARASLFDRRIVAVRIRVEKLDVYDDLASVGVEIERRRA